jgi:hypothetical protein
LNEDGCHLVLRCKTAKHLWRNFGLEKIRKDLITCSDSKDFITHVLHLRSDLKLWTIALLWWRWKDRNKIVAGEKGNSEVKLLQLINQTVNDFEQFCTQKCTKLTKPDPKWESPSGDELKLNTDGSFSPETRS